MINENLGPNNTNYNKYTVDSDELLPNFTEKNSNFIKVNKIFGKILKDKSNNIIGSYNIFTLENTFKKIALVNIKGDLCDNNAKEFLKVIKKSITNQHQLIFINFEKLSYINCSGLNMLLSVTRLNGFNKNRIIIINTPPKFIELFNLIRFDKIFIFQSVLPFGLENITDSYFSIFKQKEDDFYEKPIKCLFCYQSNTVSNSKYYYCYNCKALIKQNSKEKVLN